MPRRLIYVAAAAGALLLTQPASASDIVLTVSGAEDVAGEIACKLFASPTEFPNGAATAGQQRVARQEGGAACRFKDVPPGTYALVVAVLPVGQAEATRDVLGRPKQPWGVSNNVRPALRGPSFQEAAFKVSAGNDTQLKVTLAR